MSEEKKKELPELVKRLPNTCQRALLKRCAGRSLTDSLKAFGAYYAVKPSLVCSEQEERHFTVVCLSCLWKDNERGNQLPLEECLRRVKESESLDRRVMNLLDFNWDEHNNLFQAKLYRLVQLVKSRAQEFSPDFARLYQDLLRWDHPVRFVQKRWARVYFNENTDNQTEEEE